MLVIITMQKWENRTNEKPDQAGSIVTGFILSGAALGPSYGAVYISVLVFTVVTGGTGFLAGMTTGVADVQSVSIFGALGLYFFLLFVAPFVAAGIWGNLHGVTVGINSPAGLLHLRSIPFLGFFDGFLGYIPPLVIILIAFLITGIEGETLVGQAIRGLLGTTLGYVITSAVFLFGTAWLFNFGAEVVVSILGQTATGNLKRIIVYPDPRGAVIQLFNYTLRFTIIGVVFELVVEILDQGSDVKLW